MSLAIHFRRMAQSEFDSAVIWYDEQQAGIGDESASAVEQVLDEIALHPYRFPIVLNDVRQAPVSRFPFCIYYRVRDGRVVVISVFHTSRDPAVWKNRK